MTLFKPDELDFDLLYQLIIIYNIDPFLTTNVQVNQLIETVKKDWTHNAIEVGVEYDSSHLHGISHSHNLCMVESSGPNFTHSIHTWQYIIATLSTTIHKSNSTRFLKFLYHLLLLCCPHRMASSVSAGVAFAVAVMCMLVPSLATVYTVGDTGGWVMGTDYSSWTSDKTFTVGDSLGKSL